MPDANDERRRYTEQEVGVILRRAAELQQHEPGAGVEPSSLSLKELEQVAREAGIDPRFVRRAAQDVAERAPAGRPVRFLGAPLVLVVEREVDGEAGHDDYEALVEEIRGTLNDVGSVNTLGRSFAWRSTNVQRLVSVTITPRGGRTRIRVEERLTNLAGGLFGGIGGGLGGAGIGLSLGVGIGGFDLVGAALIAAVGCVIGSYALARAIYRGMAGSRARRLTDMADRLVDLIARR